jgi:hypothetical protein
VEAEFLNHRVTRSVWRPVWRRGIRDLGDLVPALLLLALATLGACAPSEPPALPAPPPEAAPPSPAPPSAPLPPAALLDRHGRLIVEAMEYPWSALGRLNSGGRGFCTGILIGPRLVLSQAHCLYHGTEGRWWAPGELHFVAGYQRDAFLIHAGVAGYEVAPEFSGGRGASLAEAAGDWALVTLEAPIGLQAGWLALQRLDPGARARLTLGEGLALQAGYRRGWAHSLTVKLGCLDRWQAGGGTGGPCAGAPASPELPFLLFLDGAPRALANPLLLARAEAGRIAAPAFRTLPRRGSTWGESRAPDGGGPATPVPADTVTRLLLHLGYLDGTGPRDGKARDAAIRRAERDHGLPPTGRPSPALLARLLAAARQGFLPAPRVSMAEGPGSAGELPPQSSPIGDIGTLVGKTWMPGRFAAPATPKK